MSVNENARTLRSKPARRSLFLNADGKCQLCGVDLEDNWHADHSVPWSKGGKTNLENLKAVCKNCNLTKGDKIMENTNINVFDHKNVSSFEYENMNYFKEDFPSAKPGSVRTCQVGAYNCIIDRVVREKKNTCSVFLPTGTGKSDVQRMVAIGLCQKRKMFAGVWSFSPNKALRSQLKSNNVRPLFSRLGYVPENGIIPFMEIDDIDTQRFRNGTVLESFTVQLLTTNFKSVDTKPNINFFVDSMKKIRRDTGKNIVAIFDECHFYSDDNTWGKAAMSLMENGAYIILITGTPFRSDDVEIPGFNVEDIDEKTKNFVRTSLSKEDPLSVTITRGIERIYRRKLVADYSYDYKRAWEDKVILKPQPYFVDGTDVIYEEITKNVVSKNVISEMPVAQASNLINNYLINTELIRESVTECIKSIRKRKAIDNKCAAIVATLADTEKIKTFATEEDEMADMHAERIKREFNRQAPDLRVMIVTSRTNADDGLNQFRNDESYDVLIVKAMGTIGYDCPRIKTVLNLSNYRTLPAFYQLINRGCRITNNQISHYDVIMTKDKGMVSLWNHFQNAEELIIEKSVDQEIISITEKEIGDDPDDSKFFVRNIEDINISTDCNLTRNLSDEIIELFDSKMDPELVNTWTRERKLKHYEEMAESFGSDWLHRKKPHIAWTSPVYIDPTEEEYRLRQECNENARIIINSILNILSVKGDARKENYSKVAGISWTTIKRNCGFRSNQSLGNLTGINNYRLVINFTKSLIDNLTKIKPNPDFDYKSYLNNYRNYI